ncbi:MAG: ABC transporter substrate-binding protein [Alphaproteobacteria bacterium]|nr:MAG: ABC transporter substrate-binding protein [Alphaproteobacteria bacterium]
MMIKCLARFFSIFILFLWPTYAFGQEIRYMCYDTVECAAFTKLMPKFNEKHPDIKVKIDIVPFKAIRETLPVQLAAGEGPDMAALTDLSGLNEYYLDLRPYIDNQYWQKSFGRILDWYRDGEGDDRGIYGLHTQLTLTGAYINKTLFQQANVPIPVLGSSWDEWARASKKVASLTDTYYPMALDRSGHRFMGPVIAYGAQVFDGDKVILVDDAFAAYTDKFVSWFENGIMAREIWAVGGTTYKDARREFVNGEVVFYFSGSWQVKPFDAAIGGAFDWVVVGSPCGAGGCTGMPGGTGLVGFKQTKHPEAVAKFINFFAQEDIYQQLISITQNIPAHKAVAEKGVDYGGMSDTASRALEAWTGEVLKISPIAFRLQGYKYSQALFDIVAKRITQAVVGELSVEQAMMRCKSDLAKALANMN